jgi:hypothetical protein
MEKLSTLFEGLTYRLDLQSILCENQTASGEVVLLLIGGVGDSLLLYVSSILDPSFNRIRFRDETNL